MPNNFHELGVRSELVARLDELGIRDPYPIQSATLPGTLAGRDLFAQSPTGSGKTLAFAIPLVSRIGKATSRRPRALVLAPTRELAAQIAEVLDPLAKTVGRRVASFYGGVGYREQLTASSRGVDIAVACPGRLEDLVERGAIDLRDVEVVVVDEADRMADMGFLPPVRRLLRTIEGSRQTMLFSATVSREVEQLVAEFQSDPERHLLNAATHEVGSRSHEFWRVARDVRTTLTAQLVATLGSSIVFCRTKHGADRLARQLTREGITAVVIHGDRSQAQRDRALAEFREQRAQVLVGTDVAARGLHVDGVDCVVHFDPPEDEDTYLHRSGRTGRAGASGRVVSLVAVDQERAAKNLERRFGSGSGLMQPPSFDGSQVRRVASPAPGAQPERNGDGQARSPKRSGAKTGQSAAARRRQRPRGNASPGAPRARATSAGSRRGDRRAS